uniref:Uncharacterized protein n=1 Tax=Amblyomma triste TaxID=251400 RepID=A0A023GFF3_AMBTT
MSNLCSHKAIRVERSSVNSVLLNGEPQNPHPRLLVSCFVGQSATSDHVLLRNTTLLPAVPGLHCLMPVLFAPYVELRVNAERSEYTGALCGLGYESPTNIALYPEHDLELAFDIAFTDEDLFMVNRVRMIINLILQSAPGLAIVNWSGAGLASCQDKARQYLLNVITKKRQTVKPRMAPRRYVWNLLHRDWRVHAVVEDVVPPENSLLPLLDGVTLEPSFHNLRDVRKKLQDLHVRASNCRDSDFGDHIMRCPVCDVMSMSPYAVLQHLRSEVHIAKEQQVLELYDKLSAEHKPKGHSP